jgi:hypothetical protein
MTPERWRQLEELYDAMKDLSPAKRGVRLKDSDPELRSAVESPDLATLPSTGPRWPKRRRWR